MEPDDWCHFTCRVARSRLHKLLKGGEAPYEDEKFAFLAVARQPVRQAQVMITQSSYSIPSTSTMRICAAIRLRRQASFPGEVTATHRIPLQVVSTMQATM